VAVIVVIVQLFVM